MKKKEMAEQVIIVSNWVSENMNALAYTQNHTTHPVGLRLEKEEKIEEL